MKTLYLECNMGAAGDMLTAALLELLPSPEDFVKKLNALNIPKVTFKPEKSEKCGITGTHMEVEIEEHHHHHHDHEHHHHHHHTSLADIKSIVSGFDIPENVKNDIFEVYGLIAEAEATVHGSDIDNIHFHEVGTLDAIADVTAVCMLINEINPDEIIASPVNTGSGTVECAHGVLPVPAPATALLLKGIPVYCNEIKSELCTPTGAALLKHFVNRFGDMPEMTYEKIGYGTGKKDFPVANCLRAVLGERSKEKIIELSCNLDDMTGEEIAFAAEMLLENGANDVFTEAIGMKKSRPAVLLRVLCKEEDREKFISLIFKHTSTIGIRETLFERYVLSREVKTFSTKLGEIRVKLSSGYGEEKTKIEYDDISRVAKEKGISFKEAERLIGELINEQI